MYLPLMQRCMVAEPLQNELLKSKLLLHAATHKQAHTCRSVCSALGSASRSTLPGGG